MKICQIWICQIRIWIYQIWISQIRICQIRISKIQGYKNGATFLWKFFAFFVMYQFSYSPPEEKEVPEKVQKKFQQSQKVSALIKYSCYPLLCLLDLWSTYAWLMKLQIPLLIYSSIWEIQNCEGRKRETISGRCYFLSN